MRMEDTSMNEVKSIKQAILEIDFDRTQWSDPDSLHFEGLEYVNTINIQYSEVSFAVTELG